MNHNILGEGTRHYPEYWGSEAQNAFLETLQEGLQQAPFFVPRMPRTNQPWSIRMSNLGPLGWVSDKSGYRYQPTHPENGAPWPQIPQMLIDLWRDVSGCPADPECCLVNYYDKPKAKMGRHQDRDEQAFEAPVVSLSLGDSAVFRMGGPKRRGPTQSMKLHNGDVFVFGGAARLHYHGLDRILYGSSQALAAYPAFAEGGRLNLTLRRVSPIA